MNASRDARRERYGAWAVVTGASGGIGLEIAREVAARGLNVVLAARNADKLDRLSSQLIQTHSVETRSAAVDLATPEGTRLLEQAVSGLDVGLFVGNAGFGTSGAFVNADMTNELAMIDLNVRHLAQQVHFFANLMRPRRAGGIILMSSIVSWQGVPRAANYAATKAYVQSLAEGLHRELQAEGIDVLTSAPAQVATGFMERADMRGDGADAGLVARKTLDALGRRATVYPHFKSWFLSSALSTLPRPIRVRILEGVMQDMTRHHD